MHPTNPDVLFIRSLAANPPQGDKLYRSSDGGVSFSEVLTTTSEIRDVVIRDDQHVVVATASGSFTSTNAGATFGALAATPQLSCAGQRDDGKLFGCGANGQPDFMAVARTADAASWEKVFRFVELAGPLECADGTPEQAMCGPQWPALQTQFATTGPKCGAEAHDGAPDAGDPAPPAKNGCCDAGNGAAPTGLGGALAMSWMVRRRRTVTRRRP